MGLTVAELAGHVGRTPAAVQSWEAGTTRPQPRELAALAELYGVTVDDLYARCGDPVADYVVAVAVHCEPALDAAGREAAAVILRHIGDWRRVTAASVGRAAG